MRDSKILRTSVAGGLVAATFVLVGILPSLVSAQDVDSRWLPWLGCWEASEGGTEIPMLCIQPLTGGQGVELTTWAEGENISTEAIYTDGEDATAFSESIIISCNDPACTGDDETITNLNNYIEPR